jgi:Ring finger domain
VDIADVDRYTVTYPPQQLSYAQTINDAQSLVNAQDISPSYAGLLYFPANPRNCSDPSVPNNGFPQGGITLNDLPSGFNLIAVIPISQCSSDYLMQAKHDQAEAAVLYNYTSMTNTPSTSLSNSFSVFNSPIYGIPSNDAIPLLQNMVNYAGNMSSVPLGSNLTAIYDPEDFVRLTLTINTGQGNTLPGLWLFLLVILAALGLIIASTSISMHVSQYRARRDLRRRIAAGEIDLESLGIKRLTVPKEMVDRMPIKIYGAASRVAIPPGEKQTSVHTSPRPSVDAHSRQSSSTIPASETGASQKSPTNDTTVEITQDTSDPEIRPPPQSFEESTCCAICLDDYVVDVTPVRHLPCNHIFHPHCIDPFLQTRSSLCPLCKRSVLPKGFIPPTLQLTNATVARERRIRLMRERASRRQSDDPTIEHGAIEMVDPANPLPPANVSAIHAPTQEEEDEMMARRPLYRRIIEGVFPVFTRPVGAIRSFRRNSSFNHQRQRSI